MVTKVGTRWHAIHSITHIYVIFPAHACNRQTRVPLRAKCIRACDY